MKKIRIFIATPFLLVLGTIYIVSHCLMELIEAIAGELDEWAYGREKSEGAESE